MGDSSAAAAVVAVVVAATPSGVDWGGLEWIGLIGVDWIDWSGLN